MNIEEMKDLEKLEKATRCLKALAHPIRLGILCALQGEEAGVKVEKNVGQLETLLGASQSSVSQHLASMRDREILVARREANQVFYSVRDPRMFELLAILQSIYCHD